MEKPTIVINLQIPDIKVTHSDQNDGDNEISIHNKDNKKTNIEDNKEGNKIKDLKEPKKGRYDYPNGYRSYDELMSLIEDFLKIRPRTQYSIAKHLNIHGSTTKRQLLRLQKLNRVERVNFGNDEKPYWVWRMNNEMPQM